MVLDIPRGPRRSAYAVTDDQRDKNDNTAEEPLVSWLDDPKIVRVRKERSDVLSSVASHDYSTVRNRVAAMLNVYPKARDSDVTLALRYWETFQSDLFNRDSIAPRNLFKLERMTTITRVRAKLQNEYGLFQADPSIHNKRKQKEEEVKEDVLGDAEPRRVVSIFSDETGKNGTYVIVGSVWALSGRAVFEVTREIEAWKKGTPFATREIHFTRFRRKDSPLVRAYLDLILTHRGYLSFKAIAVRRQDTRRPIEEVVRRLHEHMITEGARHELDSNRFDLPRSLEVTIDDEDSLDVFSLRDMKRNAGEALRQLYEGQLAVSSVEKTNSRLSAFVQLADVVAGAVNRKLNHEGARNFKDDFADMIVEALGLELDEARVPGVDTAVFLKV